MCLFSRFFRAELISEKQQLDRRGDTGATRDGITRRGLAKKVLVLKTVLGLKVCVKFLAEMSGIVHPKISQNIPKAA